MTDQITTPPATEPLDELGPVDWIVVEFLENHPWNQLRLPTLCRLLVRVLNDAG